MARKKCSVTGKVCDKGCVNVCRLKVFDIGVHLLSLTGILSTISFVYLDELVPSILSALIVPSIYSFANYVRD